ncbi:MAG: secondary thiamine-phosphate synthase enzyme YjbQ [Gammaproteobacteria bacterium]|jgi:secondary thiamine-phosphate synthase enzyme|nr:secondary thiamine-phosphate synthase enzyme YjbQ [Gammaproteobacteria bacterium]
MVFQEKLTFATHGRGTISITDAIRQQVHLSGITTGLCHVFLQHTSASLLFCENADPDVRTDLERYMARLVADGDPIFEHTAEGPDDMSAHIRTMLSGSDLTLPVSNGQCDLGVWQGVYLWEHRTSGHRRSLTVTVSGE